MVAFIIQIYEVQNPTEAQALVDLGADHIGSVIRSENDWKLPMVKDTVKTVQAAGAKSSLIPLYNSSDAVVQTLDYYRPDIVHFCEALADQDDIWKYCEGLIDLQRIVKDRFPDIKIMRSIPIVQQAVGDTLPTLEISKKFQSVSDYFLTDTLLINNDQTKPDKQPEQGFVGITGRTCDWNIARQLVEKSANPVILAGGISPHNVAEAISAVKPAGVDSCTLTNLTDDTGVRVRFKKDLTKVKAFVEAARLASDHQTRKTKHQF
jgi:phosphoribosylanthranilate isomerase